MLHHAVARKNNKAIEVLLGYSADINALSDTDATPLHGVLSFCIDDEKIKDCSCTQKFRGNADPVAIMDNLEDRIIETIKLLLSHNVDIHAKDASGYTILFQAILLRFNKVTAFLASVLADDLDSLKLAIEYENYDAALIMRKHLRLQKSKKLYHANLVLEGYPTATLERLALNQREREWGNKQ